MALAWPRRAWIYTRLYANRTTGDRHDKASLRDAMNKAELRQVLTLDSKPGLHRFQRIEPLDVRKAAEIGIGADHRQAVLQCQRAQVSVADEIAAGLA